MPNCITHYSFAYKCVLDPHPRYLNATFVGAQGPDPFFFYGMIKKRKNAKDVRSLGGITQHEELTPNYVKMIEYAQNSPDKEVLFAYIDGLFMHYAVDRHCHPYVFWNTGFTDRPEDSKEIHDHYNFGHLYFENILDFIVGKKLGTFSGCHKKLKLADADLRAISKMWYEVNKVSQRVPNIEEDSFYWCIKDYRTAGRITFSRFGIKKALLKKIFGPRSYPYGFSAPHNLKGFEGVDFLNEDRHEWYMPDNSGPRTETFDELLQLANRTYEALHAALMKAKNGEDIANAIEAIGNHINHEGIVPNSPKLTWKLIWPSSFQEDIIEPNIKH